MIENPAIRRRPPRSPHRAMDQLIIRLTMTKPEGEFFLKIYSVNNSLRSVIYDFRISHANCESASGDGFSIRKSGRVSAVARERPWKWDNFSGAPNLAR